MMTSDVVEAFTVRVAAGERLAEADLEVLGQANVLALGMLAETARRRAARDVTYARVLAMTTADAVDAPMLEAVSEVRLLPLPATLEEAAALVRRVRTMAGPEPRVTAFSLADLSERSVQERRDLRAVARALVEAGCDDVAELPVDRIETLSEIVQVARDGGLSASRFTMDTPSGGRRLEILSRVRDLHERLGGVRRFAPLARRPASDVPTTGYDDLRTIALACLTFGHLAATPRAVSIEVDWEIYGPKLAQVALLFGADHLDAVRPSSDPSLGARRGTVQDVERNIRAAGFEPVRLERGRA
jgi:hypothetical protein